MYEYDKALEYFRYGIDCDIFGETVASYAKLAIEAIERQTAYPTQPETAGEYQGRFDAICQYYGINQSDRYFLQDAIYALDILDETQEKRQAYIPVLKNKNRKPRCFKASKTEDGMCSGADGYLKVFCTNCKYSTEKHMAGIYNNDRY